MIKNYFKIAFRNLNRHRLFSFINIFGLALSISVCMIVLIRLKEQVGYDRFHPDAQRIFRIITQLTNKQGTDYRFASTPLPLGPSLKDQFDGIEKLVRLYPAGTNSVVSDEKKLPVTTVFSDEDFFKVFGFTLLNGKGSVALRDPQSAVIGQETSKRFFGTTDAIGKTLHFTDLGDFIVTGVLKDSGIKSYINFQVYLSMSSLPLLEKSKKVTPHLDQWNNVTSAYTYILLKKNNTPKQLSGALASISASLMKTSKTEGKERIDFDTQPLNRIILGEELAFSMGNTGSKSKAIAESVIAFIILLSACFNYTNLSIARSLKRGKEVGIRKVSGALRFHIFYQFIIESVLMVFLSLILAFGMFRAIVDYTAFGAELVPFPVVVDLRLFVWLFLFCMFTGLLAGTVPALALSSFKPVEVLKDLTTIKLFGGASFRKILITSQFVLSIFIICFTLIFFRQFHYMSTAYPGFDNKNIISLPLHGADPEILTQDIRQIKGVEMVTAASSNPGRGASGSVRVQSDKVRDAYTMDYYDTEKDFLRNFRIKMIAGTDFPFTPGQQEQFVVINETARKHLQFTSAHDAVGKNLELDDSINVQIAGVMDDFFYSGMEQPVTPLLLRNRKPQFEVLDVRIATGVPPDRVMESLKSIWVKNYAKQLFEPAIVRDQLYGSQSAWTTISMLGFLAIISVCISCLGLLGMVMYTTETRRKEIGIRKILGASTARIIALISANFVKMVLMAGIIAIPVSYITGYFFLNIFANRTSVGVAGLICCFIGMLAIVLLTIGTQVYRVAISNPVESLRTE